MQTPRECAELIASHHRAVEEFLMLVMYQFDEPTQTVRLLEVDDTSPCLGELLPFTFRAVPDDGIHFPVAIVTMNSKEWDELKMGVIKMPQGWSLEDFVEI